MKIFFCLLALITGFSTFSFADDDCAADISKYRPEGLKNRISVFDSKSKKYSKVLPSTVVKYGFEDFAVLKDGTQVKYAVGGCAHYAYSFAFKGKKIARLPEAQRLERAERLLKDLDLTLPSEKDILLNALSKAKAQKVTENHGFFQLPCGDANCTLTDPGDQSLLIGYDFAL